MILIFSSYKLRKVAKAIWVENRKCPLEGSRVGDTKCNGMRSTFSQHLQEVDGINRVKLPNELCSLGAQHSESFCLLRVPAMAGSAPLT